MAEHEFDGDLRPGRGHVRPNSAADRASSTTTASTTGSRSCAVRRPASSRARASLAAAGYSLDPSGTDVPSIAISSLTDSQTIRRTVTNVGHASATYSATVTGMAGLTTVVALVADAARASENLHGHHHQTTAALSVYGRAADVGDGTQRAQPDSRAPVALLAPASVFGTGRSGQRRIRLQRTVYRDAARARSRGERSRKRD